MSNKILLIMLLVTTLSFVGCGAEETAGKEESSKVAEQENEGKIKGIRITDGAKYQYQLVKPEDIVVEFSGLKPDMSLAEYGGRYVTDTATYMSDTVGIYLDEKRFEAKVGEYVEYTDFSWSWDSERNYDLFVMAVEKTEVSPDFFKGSIVYSDGNEIEVKPDKVSLAFKGSEVEITFSYMGMDSYEYFAVPDNWSDGEWRDEHLYEDPNESTPSQPSKPEQKYEVIISDEAKAREEQLEAERHKSEEELMNEFSSASIIRTPEEGQARMHAQWEEYEKSEEYKEQVAKITIWKEYIENNMFTQSYEGMLDEYGNTSTSLMFTIISLQANVFVQHGVELDLPSVDTSFEDFLKFYDERLDYIYENYPLVDVDLNTVIRANMAKR